MPSVSFSTLFSPMQVGAHTLKNRIAQAALSSGYHRAHGVSDRHLAFYETRARAGAAMIVTEALACHSRQNAGTRVAAFREESLDGLKRWAASVEPHGTRLVGQFVDPGRGRHHPGRTPYAIGASALPDDLSWTVPHPLTRAEISRLVAELAETAHRLQRAGFSGVELSCGHGHLFHQFLSPAANARTDEYGGDLDGRTRILREILAAIRAACGTKFLLGMKLPGDDGVEGGIGPDLAAAIAGKFAATGMADYFAVAQGAHARSLEMHVPDRTYDRLAYREITRRVRAGAGGLPVLAVGKVSTPEEAEELLAAGDADGVMLGRAMIADGAWVAKAQAGRSGDIRACIGCNTCWESIIEGHGLACVVNPRIATADEAQDPPRAEKPRRVVVVGAGVAGLEAAWVAAVRGHHVTVLGRGAGGAMALHATLPGGEMLGRLPQWQLSRAVAAGAAIHLGEEADAAKILAERPDAVLLATGASMRPAAAGQDLREVLKHPTNGGALCVVYDADHTVGTYDAALYLAEKFARLVIVTPREAVARDMSLVVRQRVLRQLSMKRIEVITLHELVGAADGTATFRQVYNHDTLSIGNIDLLASATIRAPNDSLAAALEEAGVAVQVVGDAYAPRGPLEAVAEGHRAGLAL